MGPEILPPMVTPSAGSTAAFVAIVGAVCVMFVLGVRASGDRSPSAARRRTTIAALGVLAVLLVSAVLAEAGVVRALAERQALVLFPLFWGVLAIGAALSPLGPQMAHDLPAWAIVGFQAFRLPLELVLHSWYEQGVLPVQMTYAGHNFDIVTGVLAVPVAIGLWRGWLSRGAVWIFTAVGLAFLLNVIRIAMLSSPVPFRAYHNEPAVLLAFHAPYVWIVSICVAGALFGHLIAFRWLLQGRNR